MDISPGAHHPRPSLCNFHSPTDSTSIELQRLESLSRSPIFSQFGETLEGFHTIRAYGLVEEYRGLMRRRVDCNTVNVVTLRWDYYHIFV